MLLAFKHSQKICIAFVFVGHKSISIIDANNGHPQQKLFVIHLRKGWSFFVPLNSHPLSFIYLIDAGDRALFNPIVGVRSAESDLVCVFRIDHKQPV